jgi:hypothetical protein
MGAERTEQLFARAQKVVDALHRTLDAANERRRIAADRELMRQMRDAGIPVDDR